MKALGLTAVLGFSKVVGLEGTCVELSNVCRDGAPWALVLRRRRRGKCPPLHILRRLWPRQPGEPRNPRHSPRLLPRRLITRLDINLRRSLAEVTWPVALEWLRLGEDCSCNIDRHIKWPPRLRELRLGGAHIGATRGIKWPVGLRLLDLGRSFNKPLDGFNGAWPASLEELDLGLSFDQRIADVEWPPELRVLTFGAKFNQPVEGVTWPPKLRELNFSTCFNQSLQDTALPQDLEVLMFGEGFDQSLQEVAWPPSLKTVEFSFMYGQQLDDIVWPKSLRKLTVPDIDPGTVPEGCKVCIVGDDEMEEEFSALLSLFAMGGVGMFPFHNMIGGDMNWGALMNHELFGFDHVIHPWNHGYYGDGD